MSEENRAVVRRYCEQAVNQRNLDILDEIFAPEFVNHTAPPGQESGTESLKQFFAMIETGFPDFRVTVEDLFGEGEKVAVRFTFLGTHEGEFMGLAPTGKRVTMAGIDILRVVEGRVAELWGQEDMLGMMQQLGAISPLKESAS